ncbi:MAG: autotransporter-associated beta strand repeat-containing protein, partial [Planctomycetales bacterium]|nr:autotransporter-associated beta strand repeat-containing protein [Planctomycetales bacterium]
MFRQILIRYWKQLTRRKRSRRYRRDAFHAELTRHGHIESLEDRRLLAGDTMLSIASDKLTIVGGAKDDNLTIQSDTTNNKIIVSDPNNILDASLITTGATQINDHTVEVNSTAFSNGFQINTGEGDDTLTVDFGLGDFDITKGVIRYVAGGNTAAGDKLVLQGGGTFANQVFDFTNADTGSISVSGNARIDYYDLEPLQSNIGATNVSLNYSDSAETIDISAGAMLLQTQATSTVGVTVNFNDPSDTLAVNAGDTNGDTINLNSLTTSYTASLTIDGQGGSDQISANGTVTFTDGKSVTLAAETVNAGASANVTTLGTGTIEITADNVDINSASQLTSATTITLKPQTASRAINLGTDTGGLDLTDAELDRISASTVQIGDANSGTITVSEDVTRPSSTNIKLVTGGDIVISGGQVNTGGGTLLLDSGTSPAAIKPTKAGIDVTASTLSFGSDLAIVIDGTIVDTQYTQLNVAGIVDLTNVDLKLSGSHTPTLNDRFLIVANDGTADPVVETFNGQAEGSTISFGGMLLRVTYIGGDGNDVELIVNTAPTLSSAASPVLTDVAEDETDPPGTTVGNIVVDGSITDSDGAVEAIAITAVDNTNGSWQYSIDGISNWSNLSGVSGTSSRLLDSSNKIRFVPNANYNGTSTFTFRAWDKTSGTAGSLVDTSTNGGTTAFSSEFDNAAINITALTDNPVVTTTSSAQNYTENAVAVVVDSVVSVTDVDDTQIASGSVSVTTGFTSGDVLAATTGSTSITASYDSGNGVLTLSGTDTLANYQTVLQSVTFASTSEDPTASSNSRTVTFSVTDANSDGAGAGTGSNTRDINITAVNDEPTLTATASNLTFTEDGSAQGIFSSTAVSTVEAGQTLTQIVLTVTNVTDGAAEVLSVNSVNVALTDSNSGTAGQINSMDLSYSVSLAGSTATVTLTHTGLTPSETQSLVDGLTYSNTSQNPTTADRVVTITQLHDNGLNSGGNDNVSSPNVSSTVTVVAVNNAPQITGGGGIPNYIEQSSAIVIDGGQILSDVDGKNGELASGDFSATVRIATNYDSGNDTLGFTDTAKIEGSLSGDTLTLTAVSGQTPTVSEFQAAMRSVTFANNSDNPVTQRRSIQFIFNDGLADSNTNSKAFDVTGENDAPVVTASAGTTAYTEQASAVVIDSAVTIADPDGKNGDLASADFSATVQITGNFDSGNDILGFAGTTKIEGNQSGDTLTLTAVSGQTPTVAEFQTALQSVTFANNSTSPIAADRTVTFKFNDGLVDSSAPTKAIAITLVNDAPVLDNTKDAAGATAAIVLNDVNEDALAPTGVVGTPVTSIISLANNVSDGDSSPVPVTGIALTSVDSANGTWYFTTNAGTTWTEVNSGSSVSDANALLLAADANTRIYFRPSTDFNGTVATAITFRAWDQTGTGTVGTKVDTSGAKNGGTTAFSTATDTAEITVFSGEVSLTSGNLLFNDIDGDTNDNLTIAVNGASLRISDSTSTIRAGVGATQVDAKTVDVLATSITGTVTITTQGGDDVIDVRTIINVLNGGTGTNTLNLANHGTAQNVNLGTNAATSVLSFSNISTFVGDGANDTLTATAGSDDFVMSTANDGTVAGITFQDFNNLDGAGDTGDTITGTSGTDAWILNTNDGGIFAASTTFAGIESIATGGGSDTIDLQSGSLTGGITGAGGQVTKTTGGTFTLNAASNYAGGTTLQAGTLDLHHDSAIGTGIFTISGGILQSNATRNLLVSSVINGNFAIGSSNSIHLGDSSHGITVDGTRDITVTFGTPILYLDGSIGDGGSTGAIAKKGPGTLSLTSANTFGGGLQVDAGTVRFADDAAAGTGVLTINGGTIQALNTGRTLANAVTVGGNFTISGTQDLTLDGDMDLGGTTREITVSTTLADDIATFGGVISGTGGLTKLGSRTLTYTGENTYSGPTTVSEGTLLVNGSTAAGSAVTVDSGATLGGTGTVNGTVSNSRSIAPGTSPGILQADVVNFLSNSTFDIEINGTTAGIDYDQLHVLDGSTDTDVTIGTNVELLLTVGFMPAAGDKFTIIDNDGTDAIGGSTGKFVVTFDIDGNPSAARTLNEGDKILDDFGGSGLQAYITYAGGSDNNDAVILIKDEDPVVDLSTYQPGVMNRFVLSLVSSGTVVQLLDSDNSTVVYSANADSIIGKLTIIGENGQTDSLTIDFAGGDPLQTVDATFQGGTGGNDLLALTNVPVAFEQHTYTFTNANDGVIALQDGPTIRTINYTGLEPISNDGTPTDIIFNLPPGANPDVVLQDVGGAADNMMQLAGSTFENVTFSIASVTSLTINGDVGSASDNTITVASIDDNFSGNLNIDVDDGDDNITINGFTDAGSQAVNVDGGTGTNSLTVNTENSAASDPGFEFAGFVSYDNASPNRAEILVGATYSGALINSSVEGDGFTITGFPLDTTGFDDSLTVARLLNLRVGATGTRGANLPTGDNGSTARGGIELHWDAAQRLSNLPGADFVVYESSSFPFGPDGFMVQVRDASTGTWSAWRYEIPDARENYVGSATEGAFATAYDLSDFGISASGQVDRFRIANLIATDRIQAIGYPSTPGGALLVGSGVVIPGDGGATSDVFADPGPMASFDTFGAATLDPDPLFLGALHPLATTSTFNVDNVTVDSSSVGIISAGAQQAAINYSSFGTLNVNTLGGDDAIEVELGSLPAAVNINGGDPSASDHVTITGRTGVDTLTLQDDNINDGSTVITLDEVEQLTIDFSTSDSAVDSVTVNRSFELFGTSTSMNVLGNAADGDTLTVNSEQAVAAAATEEYSYAGFTFDQLATPDTGSFLPTGVLLDGLGVEITGSPSRGANADFFPDDPNALGPYNVSLTLARLLIAGEGSREALDLADGDGSTSREGFELLWSGSRTLVNNSGQDDFVIYEAGGANSPEAFMVQVRSSVTAS